VWQILLLKGLASGTDRSCYDAIVRGDEANTFVTNHVEIMLREAHSFTEVTLERSESTDSASRALITCSSPNNCL
jgi:hypothetical protein